VIEVVTIYGDAEVARSMDSEGLARVPAWAPMLAAEVLSAGAGRVVVRMAHGAILGRYYPRAVPPWDPRGPAIPCLLGEYLRTSHSVPLPPFEAWLGPDSIGPPRLARGYGRVYPIPSENSWRPYRAILLSEEQYIELLLGGGWPGRPLEVVGQLSLDVTQS
jgi:hypothetical protein